MPVLFISPGVEKILQEGNLANYEDSGMVNGVFAQAGYAL